MISLGDGSHPVQMPWRTHVVTFHKAKRAISSTAQPQLKRHCYWETPVSGWWGTFVSGVLPFGIYVSFFPPLCCNYWIPFFFLLSGCLFCWFIGTRKKKITLLSVMSSGFLTWSHTIFWFWQVLLLKNTAQSEKWIRFHPEKYTARVAHNYEQIPSCYHKVIWSSIS